MHNDNGMMLMTVRDRPTCTAMVDSTMSREATVASEGNVKLVLVNRKSSSLKGIFYISMAVKWATY